MKAIRLGLGLGLAVMMLDAAVALHAPAPSSNAQASYVRICKDRRGMRDRRACGGREDPRRTVLAIK